MTVISRRAARNARVVRQDEAQAYAFTPSGRVEVEVGRIDDLTVGTIRAAGLTVAIMTLTAISKMVGARVDGLLGYNYLKNFRLTIDYSGSYMVLKQPKAEQ